MPSGPPAPIVSVCIVTGRRHDQLDECMRSLAAQEDAPPFELLVCADADPAVETTVHAWFPDADVVHVAKTLPSAGRNHLIERARGELLLWLDDDITFSPHLLRDLADLAAAHPDVTVFGGPNDTPPSSSRFQKVQGAVLASIVASGPVRRRYGAHPAGEADERWFILCNLAVRRHVMTRFDDDLVCAEENALLSELHDAGERMLYDPRLRVFHDRRADLGGFVRQMYKYGRGRGQLSRRSPSSFRLAYAAPAALLAYLVTLPALAAIEPLLGVPAVVYVVAVALGALKVGATMRRPSAAPLALLLIVVVHACYGAGFVHGLLRPGRAVLARRTGEPVTSQPGLRRD